MAFQTRKSRVAIVEETTEGTPKAPSAGTDYLAIQEGFTVELAKEQLENSELKASIGRSKQGVGFESPTASFPHYLRHSGTEGQAPQDGYSNLLKAAYGEENVAGAEITAAAASTTTTVKVADSSTFKIGEALLVKHASSAHEIRVIKDIPNGTDLDLLFALDVAPASGTALGKAVHYNAVDSGHPSLTVWDYRANGGAVGMFAGGRVTSFSVEAAAGEYVKASFELEGLSNYFNPLEVVAGSNDDLDFTDSLAASHVATMSAKMYKTPIELAAEIEKQMNAQGAADTYTVSYSNSTGKYTIAGSGTFELDWSTGPNTATTIGGLIGFSTAADDTGASTYTSDSAIDLSTPQTPTFDNPGDPLVAKDNHVMLGSQSDSMCFSVQSLNYELATPKTDEMNLCATSGKSGSIVNSRTVSATMVANLPQYKADLFDAFCQNTSVSFEYNGGTKTGGDWDAGKSFSLHIKEATVTVQNLGDADGLVTLEIELQGHVDSSGNSETGLNLL